MDDLENRLISASTDMVVMNAKNATNDEQAARMKFYKTRNRMMAQRAQSANDCWTMCCNRNQRSQEDIYEEHKLL